MVIKPRREEIFAMAGGNDRLTRAIEALFDTLSDVEARACRERGSIMLSGAGIGAIAFNGMYPASGNWLVSLTAWGSSGAASQASPTDWATSGLNYTGVNVFGTPGARVDWMLYGE